MSKSDLVYHRHEIFNENDKNNKDSFYINFLCALDILVNNVYYIFDYSRNKLIYPHTMIHFLGHKIPLLNQGYSFYEKCVHPEDYNLLVKVSKVAFDLFYSLKKKQKRFATIVYDIRLKEINGKYVHINHHLTPLTLTHDGNMETALCRICPSSSKNSGNVYIRLHDTKKIFEYNPDTNSFYEIKYQNLTSQQCKMLELAAKGYIETEIADYLNISVNTIKAHKKDIFKKLHVTNIPAAIQWFNNQKKL